MNLVVIVVAFAPLPDLTLMATLTSLFFMVTLFSLPMVFFAKPKQDTMKERQTGGLSLCVFAMSNGITLLRFVRMWHLSAGICKDKVGG